MSDRRRFRFGGKTLAVAAVVGVLAVPTAALAQGGGGQSQSSVAPTAQAGSNTTPAPSGGMGSNQTPGTNGTAAPHAKKSGHSSKKDREDRREKAGKGRDGSAKDKREDRKERTKSDDHRDRSHGKSQSGASTTRR